VLEHVAGGVLAALARGLVRLLVALVVVVVALLGLLLLAALVVVGLVVVGLVVVGLLLVLVGLRGRVLRDPLVST
jgi:hypothetical protein